MSILGYFKDDKNYCLKCATKTLKEDAHYNAQEKKEIYSVDINKLHPVYCDDCGKQIQ